MKAPAGGFDERGPVRVAGGAGSRMLREAAVPTEAMVDAAGPRGVALAGSGIASARPTSAEAAAGEDPAAGARGAVAPIVIGAAISGVVAPSSWPQAARSKPAKHTTVARIKVCLMPASEVNISGGRSATPRVPDCKVQRNPGFALNQAVPGMYVNSRTRYWTAGRCFLAMCTRPKE